jgi:hypothetical protein
MATNDADVTLTRAEILEQADALAERVLHTSARAALVRVRNGELAGSLFAAKIVRLFALLGENDTTPPTFQSAAE